MKNKIYFRALELQDYLISIKWRKDSDLWSNLLGEHYFVSEALEKQWIEEKILRQKSNEIVLAICLKDDDKYIGNIYLSNIDWIKRSAKFQIIIGDKSSRAKGIGSESLRMILKYAFEQRNMHRIYSYILDDNEASKKMHKKCGFSYEGKLRENVYKDGKYKDTVIMSILDYEYKLESI